MKLTKAQHKNLTWLHNRGGSAFIDGHGRLCAGGENASQGSYPSWLKLIAYGLLAGEDGRIIVTMYGEKHLK